MKSIELERLVESYPHLEEKAIVDFINGFDVMSDHLNEKKKVSVKGPSARFFDALTGHAAKREVLIDRSVHDSLVFVKNYVLSNEERLVKNERFVQEVMTGVGLLSSKLQEVSEDTAILRESLGQLSEKVAHLDEQKQLLSQRVALQELYNRAMSEQKLALSIFALKDDSLQPEQRLWLLLTRLRDGEFGRWVSSVAVDSKERQTLLAALKTLRNECVLILSQQTARSEHALIDRDTLYAQLTADEDVLRDALCLVSGADTNLLEPIILACNSGETLVADDDLPFVFSNVSIVEEMSRVLESGVRHAAVY